MKQFDKLLHFLVCSISLIILVKWIVPFPLGIILVIMVALSKEFYDKFKYGHFCWWDILADIIGLLVGIFMACNYTGVDNWGI